VFTFFKKKKRSHGMNALVLSDEGIAHACVVYTDGQTPILQTFHYSPIKSKAKTMFSLKKFIQEYKLEKTSVVTSLSIADSNLAMIERPDVEEDELVQAVRWNIKDNFSFDVDDAVIDVFDIPEQKERGRSPSVYVAAAEKRLLKKHIQLLEEQGLKVESVDIPELVMRNVAALLPEDEQGVVLLKLDATQGLMTLTHDSSLFLARNIDVGYQPLLSNLNLDAEQQDGLTLDGMPPEQQHLLDTIVLEVQRSLDYYESHFSKPSINSLVIAPIGHNISMMTNYLADALGLQVRVLDFNDVLDTADLMSDEMQAKCFFAIGTALREATASLYDEKDSSSKGVAA